MPPLTVSATTSPWALLTSMSSETLCRSIRPRAPSTTILPLTVVSAMDSAGPRTVMFPSRVCALTAPRVPSTDTSAYMPPKSSAIQAGAVEVELSCIFR